MLEEETTESDSMLSRGRRRFEQVAERGDMLLVDLRSRAAAVDIVLRIYERDKDAAGTLLGSALALRLFTFFAPLVLLFVGIGGILGRHAGVDSVSNEVGLSGSLASEVDKALVQGTVTPWLAVGIGLMGVATTGRSLTRALVLSSALSWRLGGKQKIPMRAVGIVTGIVVGMGLVVVVMNRIRETSGLAVASVSFLAVAAVYLVLWSLLYLALPRGTTDPGAALPGASVVAMLMTCLQAVTQLYLPARIDNASSMYGSVGVVIVTLGWFFFLGRTIAFSFSVNAVVYEQIGSVSMFVFGLPGVRIIPRRVPAIARFFDLDGSIPAPLEPESAEVEDVDLEAARRLGRS